MGSFISRWKKKETTIEVLERIDKEISKIEKFRRSTQELRTRVIGNLILYSILIYVIACVALYFLFIPTNLFEQCLQILPMLCFPILIYLLKRVLHWWFVRKISRNELQMKKLKEQRKEILENVMETETYKKAKEILEKFDPETKKKMEDERRRAENPPSPASSDTELRRRNPPITSPGSQPLSNPSLSSAPGTPRVPPGVHPQMTPQMRPGPRPPVTPILPRPLLRQNRTPLEKLVEYFVGDGPANRYALICANCYSHNGMALKEEFEYVEYRCAYCRFFNAARKQRPAAPRLPARVESPMVLRHRTEFEDNAARHQVSDSGATELPNEEDSDADDPEVDTSGQLKEPEDELSSGDRASVSADNLNPKEELVSAVKEDMTSEENQGVENAEGNSVNETT